MSWCDWFYMFIAKVLISLFCRWLIAPDLKPASAGLWGSSRFQSWRTQSMLSQHFRLFFWKSRALYWVLPKASTYYVSLTASVNINISNALPRSRARGSTFKDALHIVLGLRLGVGKLCGVWGFVNLAKSASGSLSSLANLGQKSVFHHHLKSYCFHPRYTVYKKTNIFFYFRESRTPHRVHSSTNRCSIYWLMYI